MKIPFDCLVIGGPTASGKTALSLAIAKRFGGEIVSADSMQIYRGMNIGTAKPTPSETEGIPHHLIDILDITQPFSAAAYQEAANRTIRDVLSRGKFPIVVGGTGLYIDALIQNTDFGRYTPTQGLREKLQQQAEQEGAEAMLAKLFSVDPETAQKLHPSNIRRIIRALEVYEETGTPISKLQSDSHHTPPPFSYRLIVTVFEDRQKLYDRINRRVDQMVKDGLMKETESLLQSGLADNPTASQAIGYKEFISYFEGTMTQEEAVDILKTRSRQYAKRQITWFKRYNQAVFLPMDNGLPDDNELNELLYKEEVQK